MEASVSSMPFFLTDLAGRCEATVKSGQIGGQPQSLLLLLERRFLGQALRVMRHTIDVDEANHAGLLSLWCVVAKRAGHSQKREDRDQRGGIAQHAAVASVGCVGGARQREDAVYKNLFCFAHALSGHARSD